MQGNFATQLVVHICANTEVTTWLWWSCLHLDFSLAASLRFLGLFPKRRACSQGTHPRWSSIVSGDFPIETVLGYGKPVSLC